MRGREVDNESVHLIYAGLPEPGMPSQWSNRNV